MTLPYLDELKIRNSNNVCWRTDNRRKMCRCHTADQKAEHRWLCSMGWGGNNSDFQYLNRPETTRLANMKRICRENGIKGYSKLRKSELGNILMSI